MSDLRKELERLALMFQKEAHAHLNWALDCEHESDEEFFHRIEQRVYEDVAEALRLALQRTAAAELTKMADEDGIPCDFALINEDGVAKWKKE